MDARQFLRLAEALNQDVSGRSLLTPALDAAACRSVTSRAYYAAFHLAHEFLDRINVVVGQSPQTHVTVQHALNNSGDGTLMAVSTALRALHAERLDADYDLARPISEHPAHAALMVSYAGNVIDQLDRLTAARPGCRSTRSPRPRPF